MACNVWWRGSGNSPLMAPDASRKLRGYICWKRWYNLLEAVQSPKLTSMTQY